MEQLPTPEVKEQEIFRVLHLIICAPDGRFPVASIEDKLALSACIEQKFVAVSPREGCIATSEGMRWYAAYKTAYADE